MARSDRADATTPRSSLTHDLRLELVGELGSVDLVAAELHYDARDPWAVRATFWTDDGPVVWDLARDLLDDGMDQPSGDGDVHVWPCVGDRGQAVVVVELASPEGWVMLEAEAREVMRFLAATHRLVAPGEESDHVDVDAALAALLAPTDEGQQG
ncbi:MAG: ssgB [Marmoricola sp.]|nr:ssgB [Marmoricola sp.]